MAAASTVGDAGFERSMALVDAGVDVVVIDTAHGHSQRVAEAVDRLKRALERGADRRRQRRDRRRATRALIDAGADAVKVGIGPGSICTTRIVAGVGVPQMTAILDCAEAAAKTGARGHRRRRHQVLRRLRQGDRAPGAHCAMVGSILAGTEEAPGEVILFQGRSYKSYRGMGSVGAMARGLGRPLLPEGGLAPTSWCPRGSRARCPTRAPVAAVLHQLVGGLRAAMGYTGNATVEAMHAGCRFVRITGAGLRESHVHDVQITRESPNYRVG